MKDMNSTLSAKKSWWQILLPHAIAIVCFLAISMIYFSPALDGKVLVQSDVTQFQGAARELSNYHEQEGKSSAWLGSMFSGMPSYQIGVWGGSPNILDYLEAPLKALGSHTLGPVFTGMLMAYILFCLMGFAPIIAILGAIAYSLSSYNIIIIDAGHITKAWALAYLPLIVASMLMLFKRKYLLSAVLLAVGLALQIKNNHLQVTYYTGIMCAVLYLAFIVKAILDKNFKGLGISVGLSTLAVALAVLSNISGMYANYEMSKVSIRGKSELTNNEKSSKESSGLDKGYAFDWSYGKAEMLTLLIPDAHGGATGGKLGKDSNLYNQLRSHGAQVEADGVQSYTYWGDQPFTSGPVYFGAIICFLFLLGMIIVKSKLKWVFLGITVLFVFLSWGKNFELFNDWFFYYFPFYNKFRTVSTALVIPAITMLVIAVWGLNDFFNGGIDKYKLKKSLYISGGITAGICFLFWIVPNMFFDFTSVNDAQIQAQAPDWYYSALLEDRKDLLSADALRSLIFIVLSFGILFYSLTIKEKKDSTATWLGLALAVLVLVDMWGIDKRYLNDGHFHKKETSFNKTFAPTNADKAILEDKSVSYRVLDLNNPFQNAITSYYHRSIGGYHAAKMGRYQELIENQLSGELTNVINSFHSQSLDTIMQSFEGANGLNMLDTKYIIFNPEMPPLVNPYALGSAWFVENYKIVENANAELAGLKEFNPARTAIIDKRYQKAVEGFAPVKDSLATIEMVTYKPDYLVYKYKASSEQLAVFSEIYYNNGWDAYIDGKPAEYVCADWTLRAMRVPAGEHQVEFKFEPKEYNASRAVTTASSGIVVLSLIGFIAGLFINRKKKA